MKRIKPVVLKDATKLTNSQMKEIRGGVTVEGRPTKCSMQCDTGAYLDKITVDCSKKYGYNEGDYCVTSATIGVSCYNSNGYEYYRETCMYPHNN